MKWMILITVFSCVFLTACSSQLPAKPAGIATKPESAPKISFGIYDLAKSPSFFGLFESRLPVFQKGIDASFAADSSSSKTQKKAEILSAKVRQTEIAESRSELARKVIRNAEIYLETAEPDETQTKIGTIAEANGGYVVESQQSMSDITTNIRDSVSITIRVPSEHFNAAVESIRKSADRLLVESEKGEDVTEEFIDIAARLHAKKALEAQFIEIMKQARSVEDALSVQTQLANVRLDIETIEGRMRFLENQSTFSTVKTVIQTPATFAANSDGLLYRFTDSTGRGIDAALNFTLNLVTFVIGAFPFALFVGLPIFFGGRALWRRHVVSVSAAEVSKEEIKDE